MLLGVLDFVARGITIPFIVVPDDLLELTELNSFLRKILKSNTSRNYSAKLAVL
jgi:hypothetical protein